MRRLFIRSAMSSLQMLHRDQPTVTEDGCVINGCVRQDELAESVQEELQNAAVEFSTLWELGDMPVLKFGDAFKTWRKEQIEIHRELAENRTTCTLPWQVLKHLPENRKDSNRLYFSQGGRPSCMGHADAFAHASTTLQMIAWGAPLFYSAFNPIVTWAITKGGSLRGGQSVSEMAKGANLLGHFPESLAGNDNQQIPSYRGSLDDATRYQSAILFLNFKGKELAEEIVSCCAAGLSVALGNGNAVSGCTIDKNGVKIVTLGGSWAHATHFTAYRTVAGTEYIGWVNSHGPRYKVSDEDEPADMCWMSRELLEKFVTTASNYGAPYVVFPESVTNCDRSLYTDLRVPFPEKWRSY